MSENVKELTPKQQQALRLLVSQPSITTAADGAGVSERTVYRWLDDPEFKQALNVALDQSIDAAARGLLGLTQKAIQTIECVIDDPDLHPSIRLKAAELDISNTLKLVELRNLAQRIAALEGNGGHQ